MLIENLKPVLNGKKILLGITGSIAAYKACETVRLFKKCGADVRVVLTENGKRFVSVTTLETLSENRVLSSLWESGASGTHHIATARFADLVLIAPATANVLAKLANGTADDLLTTECLAYRGPMLVAPAMNPMMLSHPATVKNISTLRERKVRVLGSPSGETACGEFGEGRMLEPIELVQTAAEVFCEPALGQGKGKVLLTMGGTRSKIDPVRFITNRSSGKMGASLAWASLQAGFDVTVIAANTSVELPFAAKVIRVETTEQMAEAALKEFESTDIFISAAAVLDWEVSNPSAVKLKKSKGDLSLSFVPSIDILKTLGSQKKSHQFILGFAAETEDFLKNADEKRSAKNCDAVFVNDVSHAGSGFEADLNSGTWCGSETHEYPRQSKALLAREILNQVMTQRGDL